MRCCQWCEASIVGRPTRSERSPFAQWHRAALRALNTSLPQPRAPPRSAMGCIPATFQAEDSPQESAAISGNVCNQIGSSACLAGDTPTPTSSALAIATPAVPKLLTSPADPVYSTSGLEVENGKGRSARLQRGRSDIKMSDNECGSHGRSWLWMLKRAAGQYAHRRTHGPREH